jgi:hypothetical protein
LGSKAALMGEHEKNNMIGPKQQKVEKSFSDDKVREIFVQLFVDLLKNYRNYISEKQEFNFKKFVADIKDKDKTKVKKKKKKNKHPFPLLKSVCGEGQGLDGSVCGQSSVFAVRQRQSE